MYTHEKIIKMQGKPLSETGKALILVHGRGATAESMFSLAAEMELSDFTLFAPQASQHSWYPYSFLAPETHNQPALDSALHLLSDTVEAINMQGVGNENIYLLGFSQGACLTAEFAARKAGRFGGICILTGGLIGEELVLNRYQGDFAGTPVLITTGDPDPHVPVIRVNETARILEEQGALVTKKIYPGRMHTISSAEINLVNTLLHP